MLRLLDIRERQTKIPIRCLFIPGRMSVSNANGCEGCCGLDPTRAGNGGKTTVESIIEAVII